MNKQRLTSFLVVLLIILLWHYASIFKILPDFFPSPTGTLKVFSRMILDGTLPRHLIESLVRLLTGLFIACFAGFAVGGMLASSAFLSTIFYPLLGFFLSIPTVAWVPLLIVIFGLGARTVVIAVFLGGFFEITYSTYQGIRTIPQSLTNAARTMGISSARLFFDVHLPGSLPSVLPALRLAAGYAWRALVGAEMLSSMLRWGIGKMIFEARYWNDLGVMFAGLICIWSVACLFEKAVALLEKRTLGKWGIAK